MCGIVGIVNGNNSSEAFIDRAVSMMRHRGPDDHGQWNSDDCYFGHLRLSILDLSARGHQPMKSHCGRYWIIYNGECYNFLEVKEKLERYGEKFTSGSDTEVILQAYVRWGEECLKYLNGMFAFAIWDTQEKKLFAVRDRFGIKPFYYVVKNGSFYFASEIKGLLAAGIEFLIDPEGVFQYFTFGYIQQPRTIHREIRALMPGHYLTWCEGDVSIKKYWDITSSTKTIQDYSKAKDELHYLINDSVRIQMISDRPLGIFLSSGLDSASVLAAMHSNGANIKSFSIGFEDNPDVRNEANETSELAQYFGADHHQLMIGSATVRQEVENFWCALDQPSVDGLNTYLVSKYARDYMTVALSGLGGDELFAGYSRHARILWKLAHSNSLRSLADYFIPTSSLGWENAAGKFAFRLKAFADRKDLRRNYRYARTLEYPGSSIRYLSTSLRQEIDPIKSYLNQFSTVNNTSLSTNLDRVLGLDMKAFMSSLLLRDMDATSMWHSLEVRFPLIDHRLVEFAFSLPDSFKLGWDIHKKPPGEGNISYRDAGTKKILAETMERYLPADLLDRPKNGFKLPIAQWLRGFRKEELQSMLFDKRESWLPFLQEEVVNLELNSFISGKTNGQAFWKILTFVGVINNLKRAANHR